MDDKLLEQLEKLDTHDTELLLKENINLSLDLATRIRIEQSVYKKTGYYNKNSKIKNKMNNILGGILMKKKIAVAVAAAMVISLGGGGYAYAKTPVAYVSLDINPSVELGVNAFEQVVSAEAYNEDGEKVLEGTDLINSNVDTAVSTVISNAIADGYIKEDGTSAIEITTSTDKGEVAAELEESLKETADKTLENNNAKAEVETEKVALARRDEARQLGITPGKLNLIQKLQELDPSIKVEDYKSISVKEIKKKTKDLRKNGKDSEAVTDGTNTNVSTDVNTNISPDADTNNAKVTEDNDKKETLSGKSVDSKEHKGAEIERKNNDSKEKNTTGALKKEEKSKDSSEKKEDETVKSQGNNNSSKSENKENNNGKGKNN